MLYGSWCAEGGRLFCCDSQSCPHSFCPKCVRRNLGREALAEIEDDDEWKCFVCKPKQIKQQRLFYFSLVKYWREAEKKLSQAWPPQRATQTQGSTQVW